MPSDGSGAWFYGDVTSAVPCSAPTPEGAQRWLIAVVESDDKTIRVYFVGGTVGDRTGLLRTINVSETAFKVTIALEAGGDPVGSVEGQHGRAKLRHTNHSINAPWC